MLIHTLLALLSPALAADGPAADAPEPPAAEAPEAPEAEAHEAPEAAAEASPKATAGPDPVAVKAVSAVYGKPVPAKAVCTAAPELPEEFGGSPVPVGVLRGAAGCRLVGVLVNGEWTEPQEAARTSLGEAWERARPSKRLELLEAWTAEVLLAFDQLDPEAKVAGRPGATGGYEVGATFWQRTDSRHVTRHTNGTFYFDKGARLETADRDSGPTWRTTFYVQEYRVEGVPVADVMNALSQQGRALSRCMDAAWKDDLTVEGRVRLQWTIRGGKATQLAVVDDGEPVDQHLAGCYADGLRRISFPEAMGGTVIWSFSVVRSEEEPAAE